MIAIIPVQPGTSGVISVDLSNLPNEKKLDIRKLIFQRITMLENQRQVQNAVGVLLKKKLDVLCNGYNLMSFEDKLKNEIVITKLSIKLMKSLSKMTEIKEIRKILVARLQLYDTLKLIYIKYYII